MRTLAFPVTPIAERLAIGTVALALAAIVTAIYYPALSGPFLLDDYYNLQISHLDSLSLGSIMDMLTTAAGHAAHRPISFLSFAATFATFGEDSFAFKAINLVIHLTTGALLYFLTRRLLQLLVPQYSPGQHRLIAVLAAGLWLIHPMHVSTVLYIVQRMAQLSALFVTVALLSYLGLRHAIHDRRTPRALAYGGLFFLATTLGLMSKQDAILLPAYILCIEIAAHYTPNAAMRDRPIRWLVGLLGVLPIAAGATTALVMHDFILATYEKRAFTLDERVATQLRVLWDYVRQLTIPRLSEFGLFIDDVTVTDFRQLPTYAALLAWIAALAGAFSLRRHTPLILLGVLWFFAAHALESSIIGLELVFEHRNYLAAYGVTLIIAHLACRWEGPRARLIAATAVIGLASLYTVQLIARVQTWSDYHLLTYTAVQEHPESDRAHATYSDLLFRMGRHEEGLEQLRQGYDAAPYDAGYPVVILTKACKYKLFEPKMYNATVTALRTKQISAYAINGIRTLQQQVMDGMCDNISPTHMLTLLNSTLTNIESRAPDRYEATLYWLRGVLYTNALERHETAVKDFARAIAIRPRWQKPWSGRIRTLVSLRRPDEARAVFEELKTRFPLISPFTHDELDQLRQVVEDAERKIRSPSRRPRTTADE